MQSLRLMELSFARTAGVNSLAITVYFIVIDLIVVAVAFLNPIAINKYSAFGGWGKIAGPLNRDLYGAGTAEEEPHLQLVEGMQGEVAKGQYQQGDQ